MNKSPKTHTPSKMMRNCDCFIYLCRDIKSSDVAKLTQLKIDLDGIADITILTFTKDRTEYSPAHLPKSLNNIKHHIVDYATIKSAFSNYTRKVQNSANWKIMPGNLDIPVLHLYKSHPDYDHYWLMEDDVT